MNAPAVSAAYARRRQQFALGTDDCARIVECVVRGLPVKKGVYEFNGGRLQVAEKSRNGLLAFLFYEERDTEEPRVLLAPQVYALRNNVHLPHASCRQRCIARTRAQLHSPFSLERQQLKKYLSESNA